MRDTTTGKVLDSSSEGDVSPDVVSLLADQERCYRWRCVRTKKGTDFPRSRSKHGLCLVGDYVYVYGGKDITISLRDFWRFNLLSGVWECVKYRGEKLPHLEDFTIVSNRTLLYIFGGAFSCSHDETPLWIYNTDLYHLRQHSTDPGQPHPSGRRDHSAVMYRGGMFVYGGYVDLKGSTSEFWVFDCDSEDWELISQDQPMEEAPGPRHGHTAVTYSGRMWLYGGMSDLLIRPDLWVWKFEASHWTRIRSRSGPPPLIGHTASVIGDSMFIVGGENSGQSQNDLWRFHFASRVWERVEVLGNSFSPRSRHCTVALVPRSDDEQEPGTVRSHSVPALHCPSRGDNHQPHRPRTCPSGIRTHPSSSSAMFHNRIFPGAQQFGSHDTNILRLVEADCEGMNQIEAVSRLGGADDADVRSGEVIELSSFSVVSDKSPLMEIQDSLGHVSQTTGHDNPTFSPDVKHPVRLRNPSKVARLDFDMASTSHATVDRTHPTVEKSQSRRGGLESLKKCSLTIPTTRMSEIPERRSFSADDLILEDLEPYDSLTLLFKDVPNCDMQETEVSSFQISSINIRCTNASRPDHIHTASSMTSCSENAAVLDLNNSRGKQLCDTDRPTIQSFSHIPSVQSGTSLTDSIQADMRVDHFSETSRSPGQPVDNLILGPHWTASLPSALDARQSVRSHPGALQTSTILPIQKSPERSSSYVVLDTAFIYVFGGRESTKGPQLGRQPISVWKCEIPLS